MHRHTRTNPTTVASRFAPTLTALLTACALVAGSVACTDEQERDDRAPTESEQRRNGEQTDQPRNQQAEQDQPEQDERGERQAATQAKDVEMSEVVGAPDEYEDQKVRGEARIQEVLSDRAFFIGESSDRRMMTTIAEMGDQQMDLQKDQRVRLEGRVVGRRNVDERTAEQLGSDARDMLTDQSYILLVSSAGDIDVLEQAPRAGAVDAGETTIKLGESEYGKFGEWDQDDDGELSRQEFQQGVDDSGLYDDMDADGDDQVSGEEFHTWIWDTWDADNDDELTEQEFTAAAENWDDETDWGEFDDWDADDDDILTSTEFTSGLEEIGYYDDWDVDDDGFLGEDEFSEGLFNLWDGDGDDLLDSGEIGFDPFSDDGISRR